MTEMIIGSLEKDCGKQEFGEDWQNFFIIEAMNFLIAC
jgi:hypothetical protein